MLATQLAAANKTGILLCVCVRGKVIKDSSSIATNNHDKERLIDNDKNREVSMQYKRVQTAVLMVLVVVGTGE